MSPLVCALWELENDLWEAKIYAASFTSVWDSWRACWWHVLRGTYLRKNFGRQYQCDSLWTMMLAAWPWGWFSASTFPQSFNFLTIFVLWHGFSKSQPTTFISHDELSLGPGDPDLLRYILMAQELTSTLCSTVTSHAVVSMVSSDLEDWDPKFIFSVFTLWWVYPDFVSPPLTHSWPL